MDAQTVRNLQQMKTKVVNRMAELNALSAKETRDLTPVEKMEYDTRKAEAENYATLLDVELGAGTASYQQRGGGAPGGREVLQQVESLGRDVQTRSGCSKETATVQVLNQNPSLYDQYLAANPAQTHSR